MPRQIQLIYIITIISISIYFIYLSKNNENSILGSILKVYNNNDDIINNIKNEIFTETINFEQIKKSSIYKNYPHRYKHLEEKEELLNKKIEEQKLKLSENEKFNHQQLSNIIITISFITITIISLVVKLFIRNNNKTIDKINKQIETVDKSIEKIILNKPLIEINKMKSIDNPFLLNRLLLEFTNSYKDDNNTKPILLEYKKEIEELNKKQETLNYYFKDNIENIKLLENSEINTDNNSSSNNDNNNNNNNNDDNSEENFYNEYENRRMNKDLKRASIEIQTKMFMHEYKKWDKLKTDAIEEAKRIKKENEKELRENEKRKQEEERKKKIYQESIEEIRESKFFLLSIKTIVVLNILPELMKLLFYHLKSIIPSVVCFNSGDKSKNLYFKFFKTILNNTPFSNLIECMPIGLQVNWFLILMTIAYIGVLVICLTLNSSSFIVIIPLLAISFYTYKIDYNNLNSYLVHIMVNLVLLIIWKLFVHNFHEKIISSKYYKYFISPSIVVRLITITIIIIYNISIHKYFLYSKNLIITK
ncbi:hypothetical protein RB653_004149 [Dictyostelium firmibasis]|uniref:Uncharacterized protein n=1 Tax=Dictyostelium firmibasis TaxID=79012 RepID=A0AAN7TYZ7_9MYCE